MVQRVKRLRDVPAGYKNAMVAHHQHLLLAKDAGEATALVLVVGHAAVPRFDCDAIEEAGRCLVDRFYLGIVKAGQRRRIRWVDMQDAAGMRYRAVQGAMNMQLDRP